MSTDTFRRHARLRVDRAIHRGLHILADRPRERRCFERLCAALRARSDLLGRASSSIEDVLALLHLAEFHRAILRAPEDWPGATGHPLRVVDSLASHLFGRYPTPRFLASAWFCARQGHGDRRSWFVAHAGGQRFRSLALPIAMTRQMEHLFLQTPDHVPIDHALRRAEVLGLGGTVALAEAILASRLGEHFDHPERWRLALAWLVGCGDAVQLEQVRPLVDYLHHHIEIVKLRGRTFASVLRLVKQWHGWLASEKTRFVTWPGSRWEGARVVDALPGEPRRLEWSFVELLDSRQLAHEGRAMRHCVGSYTQSCARRAASIWSLRYRWSDEDRPHSALTIEIRPSTATIVQVRRIANGRASGRPLELLHWWAAREKLQIHRAALC